MLEFRPVLSLADDIIPSLKKFVLKRQAKAEAQSVHSKHTGLLAKKGGGSKKKSNSSNHSNKSNNEVVSRVVIVGQEKNGILLISYTAEDPTDGWVKKTHIDSFSIRSRKWSTLFVHPGTIRCVSASVNSYQSLLGYTFTYKVKLPSSGQIQVIYESSLVELNPQDKSYSLKVKSASFQRIQFLNTPSTSTKKSQYFLFFLDKNFIHLYNISLTQRSVGSGYKISAQPHLQSLVVKDYLWYEWSTCDDLLYYITIQEDQRSSLLPYETICAISFSEPKPTTLFKIPFNPSVPLKTLTHILNLQAPTEATTTSDPTASASTPINQPLSPPVTPSSATGLPPGTVTPALEPYYHSRWHQTQASPDTRLRYKVIRLRNNGIILCQQLLGGRPTSPTSPFIHLAADTQDRIHINIFVLHHRQKIELDIPVPALAEPASSRPAHHGRHRNDSYALNAESGFIPWSHRSIHVTFSAIGDMLLIYIPGLYLRTLDIGTEHLPFDSLMLRSPPSPLPFKSSAPPPIIRHLELKPVESALSANPDLQNRFLFLPHDGVIFQYTIKDSMLLKLFKSTATGPDELIRLLHFVIVHFQDSELAQRALYWLLTNRPQAITPQLFSEYLLGLPYQAMKRANMPVHFLSLLPSTALYPILLAGDPKIPGLIENAKDLHAASFARIHRAATAAASEVAAAAAAASSPNATDDPSSPDGLAGDRSSGLGSVATTATVDTRTSAAGVSASSASGNGLDFGGPDLAGTGMEAGLVGSTQPHAFRSIGVSKIRGFQFVDIGSASSAPSFAESFLEDVIGAPVRNFFTSIFGGSEAESTPKPSRKSRAKGRSLSGLEEEEEEEEDVIETGLGGSAGSKRAQTRGLGRGGGDGGLRGVAGGRSGGAGVGGAAGRSADFVAALAAYFKQKNPRESRSVCAHWATEFSKAQNATISRLYKNIQTAVNTSGCGDSIHFRLLQSYYESLEENSFPYPKGFTAHFCSLGHQLLPRRIFVQFVERGIFRITPEFLEKAFYGLGKEKEDDIQFRYFLISRLYNRRISALDQIASIPGSTPSLLEHYSASLPKTKASKKDFSKIVDENSSSNPDAKNSFLPAVVYRSAMTHSQGETEPDHYPKPLKFLEKKTRRYIPLHHGHHHDKHKDSNSKGNGSQRNERKSKNENKGSNNNNGSAGNSDRKTNDRETKRWKLFGGGHKHDK